MRSEDCTPICRELLHVVPSLAKGCCYSKVEPLPLFSPVAVEVVDLKLDPDYYQRISDAYSVHPIIGHAYNLSDNMVSKENK